ncbi:hypothetical protein ACIQWR_34115 [Streptomyces sp. NPDC098789]|uniref:hypothetical protein n=1 Tax=Streptomyces sp. NPDC098789 TaxID=3366098 RepID=UPI00382A996C
MRQQQERQGWVRRVGAWLLGAAEVEPRSLAAALGLGEEDPGLRRLRRAAPVRYARVERLHRAAQRSFEQRTRAAVCRELEHAVRTALRETAETAETAEMAETAEAVEATAPPVPAPRTDVLRVEADAAARALAADAVLAGARGLNTGLSVGVLFSPVALVLALVAAEALPPLFGSALGCPERLTLMQALVCFSGGALGAVLSVVVRLRDAPGTRTADTRTLAEASAETSGEAVGDTPVDEAADEAPDVPGDPVQLARLMRQEGWYRVVVGWFLAVSLFVLITGGILALLTPPAVPDGACGAGPLSAADHRALIKGFFFWGGVGFLAGLNERWAYGLLRRGGPGADPATR